MTSAVRKTQPDNRPAPVAPDYVPPIGYPDNTCAKCWPSPSWWSEVVHAALHAQGHHGPALLFKPELVGPRAYVPEEQQWAGQFEARWFIASTAFQPGWCFVKMEADQPPRDHHVCDDLQTWSMHGKCATCGSYEQVSGLFATGTYTLAGMVPFFAAAGWRWDGVTISHKGGGTALAQCPRCSTIQSIQRVA